MRYYILNHEERNEKVEIQESAIEASKSIVITIYMMTSVSKCYEFQLFPKKIKNKKNKKNC